nr:hypothetical protein [uncultured Gemmiger sp.]
MPQRLQGKRKAADYIFWLVVALAVCLVTEYVSFGLSQMDWSVPLLYGGDGVSGVQGMKESILGSGLNGWPFYEPASVYEANYSMLYTLFVWVCRLFTKNFVLVFNLYVLVIPPVTTLSAYCVFRALDLRGAVAAAGAVTFGLCPYVQQRLAGHMGLAACECIPLLILLCFWCVEDEKFNRPGKGFFRYKRNWLSLLFAWMIANNGMIYYPFYGCFLLCVTALCLLLKARSFKAILTPVITVAEIAFWEAVAFVPAVIGMLVGAGSSTTTGAVRGQTGGDIYGLRISSLLLSPNGFGLERGARFINGYRTSLSNEEGIMYNENSMGYLGVIGVIGFFLLLVVLLLGHTWQGKGGTGDRLWLLARLNLGAVLFATISGFGAIITIFVRMIRGHTRISPYIAFVCILAVLLCAEELLRRLQGRKLAVAAVCMVLFFGYTFWEQQGFFRPDYAGVQETWASDAAFVQDIEAQVGADAIIYQLPYMKSFENGSVNRMPDYTLYRGSLHSNTLRWSYGAAEGSKNDVWNKATSELEPAAMVSELRAQGISGIYIDRDGYEEADWQALESALCQAAGVQQPLVSEQGTLSFIPLT